MQQQVCQFMTSINWRSMWLMSGMVFSIVSSMCENMKCWALNLTPYNAYFIVPIILILWILKKSIVLHAAEFCQFWSFVLKGSGVTSLKCEEKYDISFVAHFMENTIVKRFWKSVNICQTYERMYTGTVFIETRCSCNPSQFSPFLHCVPQKRPPFSNNSVRN